VGKAGDSSIGKVRDRRHSRQLRAAFEARGYRVALNVPLVVNGVEITDLDLVAYREEVVDEVFVAQAKSFLTPGDLMALDTASRDTLKAATQCQKADLNPVEVRAAVQQCFGVTLPAEWKLYQVIVVEHVVGPVAVDSRYPCVSLEWLLGCGLQRHSGSPSELWTAAKELPDARAFIDSLVPQFSLFDTNLDGAHPGKAAVFGLLTLASMSGR
jgi:hypothetical protein